MEARKVEVVTQVSDPLEENTPERNMYNDNLSCITEAPADPAGCTKLLYTVVLFSHFPYVYSACLTSRDFLTAYSNKLHAFRAPPNSLSSLATRQAFSL